MRIKMLGTDHVTNGRKVRGRNYKSIGFVLDLRSGPNTRSKLMKLTCEVPESFFLCL